MKKLISMIRVITATVLVVGWAGTSVAQETLVIGQVGDARLLAMTSLLLADELSEAYSTLQKTENAGNSAGGMTVDEREEALASTLETMASRIEALASGIEQT